MRKDLNKQLCERERVGSSRKYKHVRHKKAYSRFGEEGEMLPQHESIGYRHTNTKNFNENLNPLFGIVRKAVGKRWNDFYSELCRTFDMRSTINQHILQHLKQYCERDIFVGDDGELYYFLEYNHDSFPLKGSNIEYYVDSRDGIIKRNKHYKSYAQRDREWKAQKELEHAKVYKKIDEDNVLHCINGIWFHFTLQDCPQGKYIYLKPADKDTFECRYPKITKTWGQLSDREREKFGVRHFEGHYVRDLFTGERVFNDGKTPTRYHATKQNSVKENAKTGWNKIMKPIFEQYEESIEYCSNLECMAKKAKIVWEDGPVLKYRLQRCNHC